jgi:hypothetical protein
MFRRCGGTGHQTHGTALMTYNTRLISFAAALSFGFASVAPAQSLATFGSAELGGFGEGSALLGVSVSTGKLGWGPVGTLVAQTYRYNNGVDVFAQAYAISPSIGIQNSMQGGNYNLMVGYTFVNTQFTGIVSGAEVGGTNGVFVSAQGNYWGDGENTAQAIGSWGFADDYYWTRFRASHRLAPSSTPVYLGGEVVFQGSQQTQTIGNFTTPTQFRYELGPTIEYRFTPDVRVGASGGLRAGNNDVPSSGYVRVEFLILTKLGGM